MPGSNHPTTDTILYGEHSRHATTSPGERLPIGLASLRKTLISTIKLSEADLHLLAEAVTSAKARNVVADQETEILNQLQEQSGLSLTQLLLQPPPKRSAAIRREQNLTLTAKQWQLALSAIYLTHEQLHSSGFFADKSEELFERLSGGRELHQWGQPWEATPWACDWGECDYSGDVADMVYYNGSGMHGFLCQDCAREQIISDGLLA